MNEDHDRLELLTLNPSREQRAELVHNILAVYDRANADQHSQGMHWYDTAHELAGMIGFGDYNKGAGIIAVLSANTGWTRNVELARMVADGKPAPHFAVVQEKVTAIMGGANPPSVIGKGLKTLNFFYNIATPGRSGPVTIDRHAHDIARGERWGTRNRALTTGTRYAILKEAYRDAAALRGVRPHEMQAVTWVVWTQESPINRKY